MQRALIPAALLSAAMLSAAQAQTIGTATTDLNIRSGPDPQFPVIGMLRANRSAAVIGCIEGSRWCQVDLRGQRGWAYSQYMMLSGDRVALLEAPETEVIAPAARTTVAVAPAPLAPAPLAPAPFSPLAIPVPVPVPTPVPVATWQPAPVVAPAPVYADTPAVTYRAPAVTYRSPPPAVAYRAPAPAVTYQAPPPAVAYRAPATTTVVETTAAAPREFVGRLTAPREVVYAATTPPRAYMPPRSVRTYISMNPLETVWLEGSLAVGAGIPDDIDLIPVPGSRYTYAYVNDYPVLVDPASRRIVYVYR